MTTENYMAPPAIATVEPADGRRSFDRIVMSSVGRGKRHVRFMFSRNIIEGLVALYDKVWHEDVFCINHEARLNFLRLQIAPFHKMRVAAALVRIQPSPHLVKTEGKGYGLVRYGQRFAVQVAGHLMGFRPNRPSRDIDFAWAPYGFGGHGGIVLWFDDEDVRIPTVKQAARLSKKHNFILMR